MSQQHASIWIPGEPVPQPRHRATSIGGMARMYLPKRHPVNAWKQRIASSWIYPPMHGPLYLSLSFLLPLAKSARRKRGNPRIWHHTRGDLDNFAKAVLDALNGVAWHDDGQVALLCATKCICGTDDSPGVDIELLPMSQTEKTIGRPPISRPT